MTETNNSAPESFFPALRNSAILSAFFLIGLTFFTKVPHWLTSAAALLPLIYYHLFYLTPQAKKGLSQAAVDSVYYLGFLITIAALGVSAISLALAGVQDSVKSIAFQFGLGLLATGYAVFARMHLTSITTWLSEQGPEELMDRYLKRTQELVTNVEMASVHFAELSANLIQRTEESSKRAAEAAEQNMLMMAKVFDEQIRLTLASGNQGLSELRALISETSFEEERKALHSSMQVTLDTMTTFNQVLSELSTRTGENSKATGELANANVKLAHGVHELSSNIDVLAGDEGKLMLAANNFDSVHTSALSATESLSEVVEALSHTGESLGGLGTTFKNLKTLTSKAESQLGALVETAAKLEDATAGMADSTQRMQTLGQSMANLNHALPTMAQHVSQVSGQLDGLQQAAGTARDSLRSLPEVGNVVTHTASDLNVALEGMQTVLLDSDVKVKSLSTHFKQHMDQANTLKLDASLLKKASEDVDERMSVLMAKAAQTEASFGKSAAAMQQAVQQANESVVQEVKNAAQAASLFTDRLVHIADKIIGETSKAKDA